MSARRIVGLESPITGDQLLRLGDIGPCELVAGRIVPMSPTGGEHGRIEFQVAARLSAAVSANGIRGYVLTGEVGIYTRRAPDTVRGADVVFISAERAARQANPRGFLDVPPELVVEVMSPDDSFEALRAKALRPRSRSAALAPRSCIAPPAIRLACPKATPSKRRTSCPACD